MGTIGTLRCEPVGVVVAVVPDRRHPLSGAFHIHRVRAGGGVAGLVRTRRRIIGPRCQHGGHGGWRTLRLGVSARTGASVGRACLGRLRGRRGPVAARQPARHRSCTGLARRAPIRSGGNGGFGGGICGHGHHPRNHHRGLDWRWTPGPNLRILAQ